MLTADQDEILSRAQRLGNEIAIKPLFPTDRWQNAKRAGNPLSPSFEDDVQMQCVLAAIKESAAAKSTTIQI